MYHRYSNRLIAKQRKMLHHQGVLLQDDCLNAIDSIWHRVHTSEFGVTSGPDTVVAGGGITLAGTNAAGATTGGVTIGGLLVAAMLYVLVALAGTEAGAAEPDVTTGLEGTIGCELAIYLSNAPTLVTSSISCRKVTFTPNRCRISWLN